MREQNNQVQLKNFNRRAVLNYIRRYGVATKAGLASATGLTFMAIKKILEELEGLNLIKETESGITGAAGRKAAAYVINEAYSYTIGVHINKFATSVAVLNLCGKIVEKEIYPLKEEIQDQWSFLEKLTELIKNVIKKSGIREEEILGIGVGVPGPLDLKTGIVLTPPNMPMLSYLPLKDVLEEKTGLNVMIHKDTNVIAYGEYWHGKIKNVNDLIYVDVDMGIGSGMIIDGNLNVGINGIAGEFGHTIIETNGPLCNCGNRGCLEAMSSGLAILRKMKSQLEKEPNHPLYGKRDTLTIEDIFAMTEKKDLMTISILNKSAFYLGVAISNLINFIDPQIILLGGLIIQNYPRYFDIVMDVVNVRKLKEAKKNVLQISNLGQDAGVIGAGEIVVDYFFNERVNEVFIKNP